MSVIRLTPTVAVAVFLCAVLPGAASQETPAFEVASIKLNKSGPGSASRLESQKSDVEVLVIDHVEHPSED